MHAHFSFDQVDYKSDLSSFIDISIPLKPNQNNPNCFFAPPPTSKPVRSGDFVGSIREGGLLNFKTLQINPHGNGTHTECYGHIEDTSMTINQVFKQMLFPAVLLSAYPELREDGDRVIGIRTLELMDADNGEKAMLPEALIIRTLPNSDDKLQRIYSGTNPPYVSAEFLIEIRKRGVKHLLIDLPSVDREQDEGRLAGHKAFWGIGDDIQKFNTITELIYVDSMIKDGLYLLQMSICPLEIDASPSKPVIYKVQKAE